MAIIILSAAYFIGFILSYWMLKIDHISEGQAYTHGMKAFNILLSILSWLMVLITLVAAWVGNIKRTGYWSQPINKPNE
jgi:hypothetical protein